jgi:hypothetical protein
MAKKNQATQISTDLWGGIFHSDNRGFYTSLEFLALVGGRFDDEVMRPPDEGGQITITAPGYITARRLAFDALEQGEQPVLDEFIEKQAQEVVKQLLRGLKVHIPNTGRAGTSWAGSHFVPYGKGLVHWDGRHKRKRPLKERIYLRGAGTLAYVVLCSDADEARLRETRAAFDEIFGREHFLGSLLSVFEEHEGEIYQPSSENKKEAWRKDWKDLQKPLKDTMIARDSHPRNDEWDELLRHCVHAIVTARQAPYVVRLDALFHIIPLCLTLSMFGRSHERLDLGRPFIVVDCSPAGGRTNEVRQASHRSFSRMDKILMKSLEVTAEKMEFENITTSNLKQFRSWFTRGASAIGLSNALKGTRRFTLGESLLEALVLATGRPEMTLESFVEDWLYKRFGFVIDEKAAKLHDLDLEADLSVFEDNARYLSDTLDGLGLMQSYSDSTRMVRYES